MNKKKVELAGRQLVDRIVKEAFEKKVEGMVVFYNSDPESVTSWIVLCQGTSTVHNKAIAENIMVQLKKHDTPPYFHEGMEESRWILIDYVDVVVHILLPELYNYYDLEKLWKHLEKIDIGQHR